LVLSAGQYLVDIWTSNKAICYGSIIPYDHLFSEYWTFEQYTDKITGKNGIDKIEEDLEEGNDCNKILGLYELDSS
jgi:hypothetical protein